MTGSPPPNHGIGIQASLGDDLFDALPGQALGRVGRGDGCHRVVPPIRRREIDGKVNRRPRTIARPGRRADSPPSRVLISESRWRFSYGSTVTNPVNAGPLHSASIIVDPPLKRHYRFLGALSSRISRFGGGVGFTGAGRGLGLVGEFGLWLVGGFGFWLFGSLIWLFSCAWCARTRRLFRKLFENYWCRIDENHEGNHTRRDDAEG
jgi:hypothetical protein